MQDDFDRALQGANIGRRYQSDHSWLTDVTLAIPVCVEGILEPLRDERRARGADSKTIPEVLSGVNDSPAFNAFAFEYQGQYALAINYGALVLVQDLVNRLFSIPELFPWVGNPTMEDPNRSFHPTSGDAMEYMRRFIAEPRQVVPRDPIRRDAAKMMFVAALEFVYLNGSNVFNKKINNPSERIFVERITASRATLRPSRRGRCRAGRRKLPSA